MKVLVVDDSGLMRRAITKIASDSGVKSIEAINGEDCLSKLQENASEISLIILDWNMPIMDGYEVLLKIRSKSEYDHIQILMATADGVEEDIVKAVKAGADSYLVKPFTPETLSERIRNMLNLEQVEK